MFFFKRWTRRGESPAGHSRRAAASIGGVHSQGTHTVPFAPAKSIVFGLPDTVPLRPVLGTSASQQQCLHGVRLLLAEDHEINAQLLIEELELFGAHVDHALDGEAACRILMSGEHFDAVLMDCQMPNVDGYAATRCIRRWEAEHGRRAVPIIAVTGLAQDFDLHKSSDAGMNGYLVKPCGGDEVATAVLRLKQR